MLHCFVFSIDFGTSVCLCGSGLQGTDTRTSRAPAPLGAFDPSQLDPVHPAKETNFCCLTLRVKGMHSPRARGLLDTLKVRTKTLSN